MESNKISILIISLCMLCLGTETIQSLTKVNENDDVYVPIAVLDSIGTQKIMEDALFLNYINSTRYPYIFMRRDMAYLPYLFLTFSSSKIPPLDIESRIYEYIVMCSVVYDDKGLYELGRQAVNKLNKRCTARPEKVIHQPDGYTVYYKEKPIPYYSFGDNVKAYKSYLMGDLFVPSRIDTLRVRTIAHNDRNALMELEKYYRKNGDDLGIAIYYKALLCRDGNGDLAERLYRVLQPYFYDRPEFENAAREALIRAAICDSNKRAQELCDSLGYSFCDYKVR